MGANVLIHRLSRLLALVVIVLASVMAGSQRIAMAQGGGGNQDCPAGTVQLAKFNFSGGQYVLEGTNSGGVVISNADADGGDWSSTSPVSHIIVKGSNESFVTIYQPPATSGEFDNSGLTPNRQGNLPDISNIKFCGPEEPPPPPPSCCLEAYGISLFQSGGEVRADVAVRYTDGYIPDNVDVTVQWTTPSGVVTQTRNTSGDNIASFSVPRQVGFYSITVTNADGFDGTAFCRTVTASGSVV